MCHLIMFSDESVKFIKISMIINLVLFLNGIGIKKGLLNPPSVRQNVKKFQWKSLEMCLIYMCVITFSFADWKNEVALELSKFQQRIFFHSFITLKK